MAIQDRQIEEIVCDSCGHSEEIFNSDIPEEWYTGFAMYHSSTGGSGENWAACKVAHIKDAVLVATGIENERPKKKAKKEQQSQNTEPVELTRWLCSHCGKILKSERGLKMHMARSHPELA